MLLLPLLVFAISGAQAQDAAAGKKVFEQCAACHTVDGESPVGPTLKSIVGRKAGSIAGFRYSRVMKSSSVVWDERALDAYIADPQAFMPGNLMPFAGIMDAGERASLIAYLKSLP
jgi:cytochrome c